MSVGCTSWAAHDRTVSFLSPSKAGFLSTGSTMVPPRQAVTMAMARMAGKDGIACRFSCEVGKGGVQGGGAWTSREKGRVPVGHVCPTLDCIGLAGSRARRRLPPSQRAVVRLPWRLPGHHAFWRALVSFRGPTSLAPLRVILHCPQLAALGWRLQGAPGPVAWASCSCGQGVCVAGRAGLGSACVRHAGRLQFPPLGPLPPRGFS